MVSLKCCAFWNWAPGRFEVFLYHILSGIMHGLHLYFCSVEVECCVSVAKRPRFDENAPYSLYISMIIISTVSMFFVGFAI